MPDTVFDEDTLAAASEAMGEEEERPLAFAELGVPGPLVRVLAADDKKTAFPIQADTLPDSLAGRDILGRGRTGSGKTLAFSIPLVARLGEVDAGEYENMSQFIINNQLEYVFAYYHISLKYFMDPFTGSKRK